MKQVAQVVDSWMDAYLLKSSWCLPGGLQLKHPELPCAVLCAQKFGILAEYRTQGMGKRIARRAQPRVDGVALRYASRLIQLFFRPPAQVLDGVMERCGKRFGNGTNKHVGRCFS